MSVPGVLDPLPRAAPSTEPGMAPAAAMVSFQAPWWAPAARVSALALTDLTALLVCCVVAWSVWAGPVLRQPAKVYIELLPLLGVFTLGYARAGLYPGFGLGAVETIRRLTLRSTFVFVVLAAAAFALKLPPRYSRLSIALVWVGSLFAVPLARFMLLSFANRMSWWGEPTVVVGNGARLERIVDLLRAAVSLGYRPVAAISARPGPAPTSVAGLPVRGGIDCAGDVAAHGARIAIVAGVDNTSWGALAAVLRRHFRHVVLLMDNEELPVETVAVRNLGGVLGIELANHGLLPYSRFIKRCMDIALGGALLALAAPVIAVAAMLVKLRDRGPAFFVQEREGRAGSPIKVRKLRTMYVDAETRLENHLSSSPEARLEWARRFKLERDPRITPVVGSVLRRLSIDELPQLWSVMKGEMSLVGPRPLPRYHIEAFPESFLDLRRSVRPGLTGLWQVMVRSDGGVDEQVLLDTYYIRNWSIWMDVYILGRTLAAVVRGRGAY